MDNAIMSIIILTAVFCALGIMAKIGWFEYMSRIFKKVMSRNDEGNHKN